jgi:hypothetical protein
LGPDDLVLGCTPEGEKLSKFNKANGRIHKHSPAAEVFDHVGAAVWKNYLSFTFVRDPLDMVLSQYFWWHKTPAKWSERAKWQKKRVMGLSFEEFVYGIEGWGQLNLHRFILPAFSEREAETLLEYYDRIRKHLRKPDHNLMPEPPFPIPELQSKILPEFIGRYENLAEDFQKVCERIGIPEAALKHSNSSMELRAEKKLDDFYDQKSREFVRKKFDLDVRLLGY